MPLSLSLSLSPLGRLLARFVVLRLFFLSVSHLHYKRIREC
jgi:hypothetical protein